MKIKITISFSILLFLLTSSVFAQSAFKVGYVNMNRAINQSDEGRRSKKFLEAQFNATRQGLDVKRQTIQVKERELSEGLMLSVEAKAQKTRELGQLKTELKTEMKREQDNIRRDEQRHTKKIFQDLLTVVKTVSEAEKLDLVLEYNVSQTILYSRLEFNDITEKVILEYNKLQAIK
jgi:outer membrane protein